MLNNENKIVNNNLPLFSILCFCAVIYFGFITSYWYLLLLALVPLTFSTIKINWKQWIICGCFIVTFIFLVAFCPSFSLIDCINQGLDKIGANSIKNAMINFLNKNYNDETSSFIKLILFNIKSDETIVFYKQTIDLGIVWLICVSGFHISLLSRMIKFIFKKKNKLGAYINIAVIGFYSFLLNFSYASLRILMKLCFDRLFLKIKIEKYNRLGFIGLCICILNPACFESYSFLLSFIICISVYFIISLDLNNKIIISLLINIAAFIVTIPFVIEMNHKISLLTFLNAFIFRYFSSFLFLYFWIFAWMPFMAIIHWGIIVASYVLIGNISFSNIYLFCLPWESWLNSIYYIGITLLSKLLYLIVFNNKI